MFYTYHNQYYHVVFSSGLNRIFQVLTKTMEEELPASVNNITEYAASPGVILPIFMLLGFVHDYVMKLLLRFIE